MNNLIALYLTATYFILRVMMMVVMEMVIHWSHDIMYSRFLFASAATSHCLVEVRGNSHFLRVAYRFFWALCGQSVGRGRKGGPRPLKNEN